MSKSSPSTRAKVNSNESIRLQWLVLREKVVGDVRLMGLRPSGRFQSVCERCSKLFRFRVTLPTYTWRNHFGRICYSRFTAYLVEIHLASKLRKRTMDRTSGECHVIFYPRKKCHVEPIGFEWRRTVGRERTKIPFPLLAPLSGQRAEKNTLSTIGAAERTIALRD